jgi:UDP-glucose 4-epimerase
VEDVVSAIMIFVEKGTKNRNATYEVGTGQGYKVSDIVKHAGYDVPTQEGQDAEADNNTADNKELIKLGWKPTLKPTEWIDIKIAVDYTNKVVDNAPK